MESNGPINRAGGPRSSASPVVVVHGLLLGVWAMRPLAARLREAGFAPTCFGYPTVRGSLAGNVTRLVTLIESLAEAPGQPARRVHCVVHSLGGLLLRHACAARPGLPLAACVMLGTPNRGSHVARRLSRLAGFRALLACGMSHGLGGDAPEWPAEVPVRVIAGTRAFGFGRVVPGLGRPNDGTVALDETRLDAAGKPLTLHQTHTGMLFSGQVAAAVVECLREGGGDGRAV